MNLTFEQLNTIKDHTLSVYPNESVFVIDNNDTLHIMDNIANDPENFFEIELGDLYDNIKYLIHSHTYKDGDNVTKYDGKMVDPRMPSKMDMQLQMLLDIEFGIISCNGREVSDILQYPDLDGPILGVPYIDGVNDCYSIIRRWFWQNRGVVITEHPRNFAWYKDEPNIYLNCFRYGFEEVDINDYQIGDMLIFRLGRYETHGGIYVGDGKFIHHMNDQLSRKEDLSVWIKRLSRVVRYVGTNNE